MNTEITHFHLFCGLGGGALGFQAADARVGSTEASMRCLGGIDSDPAACRDFESAVGLPATCLDLFDHEQYEDFHGEPPPPGWEPATPEDFRRAAGREAPDLLFTSPPCKGFSGLLNPKAAAGKRYQALNQLVPRALFLALEAWQDDPPAFVLLENVPRIQQRGGHLLSQVEQLLEAYGYAVARTTHDCGELGGLAQHRRRFLLVARHRERVPPFLYEPPRRRVRAVGEVLEQLPLPDDPAGGCMHNSPRLTWKTWVRLALIPAGKDWRALQQLEVEDGYLKHLGIVPASYGQHYGKMRVEPWGSPCHTVTGSDRVGSGALSVADPRSPRDLGRYEPYKVLRWDQEGQAVTSQAAPGAGPFSVADPRRAPGRFNNTYRVVDWRETSPAITGGTGPSAGGLSVADPRTCSCWGGHYGVVPWALPAPTVVGQAKHDRGPWTVADPRLPGPQERPDPVPLIVALDGTWHRPFTTAELGALQGFPFELMAEGLDGRSSSAWRGRIGNAVPPPAAQAIASTMAQTLLLARAGTSFMLGSTPIWVDQRLAVAAAVGT